MWLSAHENERFKAMTNIKFFSMELFVTLEEYCLVIESICIATLY